MISCRTWPAPQITKVDEEKFFFIEGFPVINEEMIVSFLQTP